VSKDFKRRKRYRQTKKTFLLICEGSCEEIYFKYMKRNKRLTNINIEILNPKISIPSGLYKYTKRKQKERQYDKVFWVLDGDVLKQYDKNPESRIKSIISNPCFEVWFVLHYKYTSKEFYSCDNLINLELKRYIPDYEKSQIYHSKKNFYEILKKNLNDAIYNAKKLDKENKKSGKPKGTSTGIYKIIEEIFQEHSKE